MRRLLRFSVIKERIKVDLKHIINFYWAELKSYGVWWVWNIPFQVASICVGIASYFFFTKLFVARNPAYLPYGDPISFIIMGLATNTLLHVSLTVYYETISALYGGRVGVFGGLRVSQIDYLYLARIPPYTFIIARVSLRYFTHTILLFLYILAGTYIFGLRINPRANIQLATIFIVLGVLACSGIGLVSASMYWFLGTYRGVEPIRWFVTLIAPLVSGIYYPIDVLPPELRAISYFLPHTYTVRGVREALLYGSSISKVMSDLLALLLFTALVPVGVVLVRKSLSVARKRGVIY